MNILLAIALGSFFGFALYKAGASNPKKLLSMLRLEDLTLMKVILFAIGLSSVLIVIANSLGVFNIDNFSVKAANLGVITGGLLFGAGFGWAGTCPGTCVAAAGGAGFKKAVSAVIGGLLGAFAFSMSYGWFKSIGLFDAMDLGKITLFKISGEYPSVFGLGFAGLLLAGILLAGLAWVLPAAPFKGRTSASRIGNGTCGSDTGCDIK